MFTHCIDYDSDIVPHLVWAAVISTGDLSYDDKTVRKWINEVIRDLNKRQISSFQELRSVISKLINAADQRNGGIANGNDKIRSVVSELIGDEKDGENKEDSNDVNISLVESTISSKKDILHLIDALPPKYFTMGLRCCKIFLYDSQIPSHSPLAPEEIVIFFSFEHFKKKCIRTGYRGIKLRGKPKSQVLFTREEYDLIVAGADYRQVQDTGMSELYVFCCFIFLC